MLKNKVPNVLKTWENWPSKQDTTSAPKVRAEWSRWSIEEELRRNEVEINTHWVEKGGAAAETHSSRDSAALTAHGTAREEAEEDSQTGWNVGGWLGLPYTCSKEVRLNAPKPIPLRHPRFIQKSHLSTAKRAFQLIKSLRNRKLRRNKITIIIVTYRPEILSSSKPHNAGGIN